MSDWRPTRLIRDPTETDMPCKRPIGDHHASPEAHQACWSPIKHIGLPSDISVSDGSPIRHASPRSFLSVSYHACQSPMGLRSDMSVSDRSPIRHVDLRWSLMRHVCLRSDISVSDGSPIMYVSLRWVSDQACRSPICYVGLRSVLSVSDQACQSPIRHVSL